MCMHAQCPCTYIRNASLVYCINCVEEFAIYLCPDLLSLSCSADADSHYEMPHVVDLSCDHLPSTIELHRMTPDLTSSPQAPGVAGASRAPSASATAAPDAAPFRNGIIFDAAHGETATTSSGFKTLIRKLKGTWRISRCVMVVGVDEPGQNERNENGQSRGSLNYVYVQSYLFFRCRNECGAYL